MTTTPLTSPFGEPRWSADRRPPDRGRAGEGPPRGAGDGVAGPRPVRGRHPRVEGEAERRRPRAQLPGARDLPRRGGHHRRLARPGPEGRADGRRGDRDGWRPLHGGDGQDPEPRQDRPDAETCEAGCSLASSITAADVRLLRERYPRCSGRDLRQHLGRGEGRV